MLQAAKILKRKKEKKEISWLCSPLYHIFFFICIFTVQKPDALCNQHAGDNAVCSLSQLSHFLSPVSEQGRGDDWQRQLRRVKNPSMDFRVLLLTTPSPPHPHFHSLPLPNQFYAGTLLTQVKGLWSSSQCLCLYSERRGGDMQGAGRINAPFLLGSRDQCASVYIWMYLLYAY